ncbi:sushi, nidogen and EGF-like domain-containing protein 1 [Onychostruthus taczanowskii]|uniref:sushi, nidogen and EGF-like domain-containing protein 1 n=1 Tax=Onychostruthus taczanowskii TaxID=356909 RepID=UPI001B80A8E2|nr:sushi, nidogen and EGF-like domain-containing protein 1 [Onychostruthus taczanowskii]
MGVQPGHMKVSPVVILLLLSHAEDWGPLRTLGTPVGSLGRVLYPFGPGVGDEATHHEDDGTSPEIFLQENFSFFGRAHRSLYVNNNGVVSFGTMVPEFTPQPFPLPGHRPFVAPYWADVDTRVGGDVFYRQSRDPQLLARLAQDLAPAVPPGDPPPQPTWAFVATWDRVAYFGTASDKVNTFQAVLASDGVTCFVLLNYGDLQWTTGIANQGDPHTGLGGIPAQAGFNSGDDVHYYNVPGSRTPAVQSLSHRSNLGVPGRWAFRVDHFEATEGPPETPGTLSKTPEAPWSPLPPHKTLSVSPNPPRTTEEQVYVCGS